MKIKAIEMDYEKVLKLPKRKNKKPCKPSYTLKLLINILSFFALLPRKFKCKYIDKKSWDKGPYFILMNHSSFVDFEIAHSVFKFKPFHIITTTDGLIGKDALMRHIGCIPTNKFTTDMNLISNITYAIKNNKRSVLMFPEAGYSFDGKATPLQRGLGVLLKKLNVPVIMIKTEGAFLMDPLYNCLQKRKVNVSASAYQLFSKEDLKNLSLNEITEKIDKAFDFDAFKTQKENNIEINEPFRADGLERVLYKCPHCLSEKGMEGKGLKLKCHNCNKEYTLTSLGELKADDGEEKFTHIPDWFKWEREEVKKEILENKYSLDVDVDICVLINSKALYKVGEGNLIHSKEGFILKGLEGKLEYKQKPTASYGLNADYFWYEIGDVICIGTNEILYYCFPKTKTPVAKARLATEEIYKIVKNKQF